MFRCLFYILLACAVFSFSAFAKPPEFSAFAVKEIYKGNNHVTQKGDAYNFERLEQVLKTDKVNFAGHYILYINSCGTAGCIMYSIVDAKTGKNVASVPEPYMGDVKDQYTPNITYKVNSKLIHVSGVSAEKTDQYLDDYYVLENNQLRKIASSVKTIKAEEIIE